MRVRQRILLYFSLVSVVSVAAALLVIHALFAQYREEEFQRRLHEKMTLTLNHLSTVQTDDQEVIETIDRQTINALFQEKLLLFDHNKKLLYSGVDDTPVLFQSRILRDLSPQRPWIETNEDGFDVVGAYMEFQGRGYYGINKAYDTFGHSKLRYLQKVLIITFLLYTLIVVGITYYLAGQISAPITNMTHQLSSLNLGQHGNRLPLTGKHKEVDGLIAQFNALMERTDSAFEFQRHAVHHISHELRTPIAIIVSNLDRLTLMNEADQARLLAAQIRDDAKSLGDIINAMLEIAKTESGQDIQMTRVRIDDLLFDVLSDLKLLKPDFDLQVDLGEGIADEYSLIVKGNPRLLGLALANLAQNCLRHGGETGSSVLISHHKGFVELKFTNPGEVVHETERDKMFTHFFRGTNSTGKRGFGLGLVLTSRIIHLHGGTIGYSVNAKGHNVFLVHLAAG